MCRERGGREEEGSVVGIERRRKRGSVRGGEGVSGLRVGKGVRGWRSQAQERDRKESGGTYRRNKCARVMLMANMVERGDLREE